jgi:integrase
MSQWDLKFDTDFDSDLPALPESVLTKDRQELDTSGDLWQLRANADGGGMVDVDFRSLSAVASPRFTAIAKLFVARKARVSATHSLKNIAQALGRAARFWRDRKSDAKVDWGRLDLAACQALLTHGLRSPTGVGGNDFAHVRALYEWGCHFARLKDFNPLVAMDLRSIRAPGNLKGQRVLSGDPETGPFSPEEVELLDQAIRAGTGDSRSVVLVQIFQELGLRPIQVLRTRWSGLRKYEARTVDAGQPRVMTRYTLSIPRAKERGENRIEEVRPISRLLGDRLEELKPHATGAETALLWWLHPDTSSEDARYLVQAWVDAAQIISPVTGEALKANPSRFRYTLATEAARDGASKFDIAHLLFQKDLQNVEVYIDAAGTVMQQIEKSLDKAFGEDIEHFLGRVASASDLSPHKGVTKRVIPGTFPQLPDVKPMSLGLGACGQNIQADGLCKLAPPLACYRCPKFAAFREADHKTIGDALEEMARTKFSGRADDRIGGELVFTIRAIRDLERQINGDAGQ